MREPSLSLACGAKFWVPAFAGTNGERQRRFHSTEIALDDRKIRGAERRVPAHIREQDRGEAAPRSVGIEEQLAGVRIVENAVARIDRCAVLTEVLERGGRKRAFGQS